MRRAMADAEVGDDVYREDPTVNRLEQRAAEAMGKEAALLIPTGVMGNTIAIKLHTSHGQEVICESKAHVLDWELAMMAWFAGCVARPVAGEDGILPWRLVAPAVRKPGPHNASTGLLTIENTHNMAGGTVWPLHTLRDTCQQAHAAGLPVHMDGARIFNAATRLGVSAREIAAPVDTVMFCLSKGLGAPAGSLLAGPADLIERGRALRKRLGGGMRQAGVLAAPGLIALEQMTERLAEDHENARLLADGLSELATLQVLPVETNIVIFCVAGTGRRPEEAVESLRAQGILVSSIGGTRLRLVTHYDVSRADCERALTVLKQILGEPAKTSP
jgi:threonine aldolase